MCKGGEKSFVLRYWNEVEDNSMIYSCDMVRYNVEYRQDCMDELVHRFSDSRRLDVTIYPISFRSHKFRTLITIDVGGSTVSLGVGFNGDSRDDNLKGFIEFNPNKVFPEWLEEFYQLRLMCSSVSISRMDIAVDIPVNRKLVTLVKDNRIYKYEMHSIEDRTEYLGRRNAPGYVKLYNKKVESKLELDLTRLEITTEPDINKFCGHCPTVYVDGEYEQLAFSFENDKELTQNDRVLCDMLGEFDVEKRKEYLKMLTYRKRKKLEPYVMPNKRLEINVNAVYKIINNIKELYKC